MTTSWTLAGLLDAIADPAGAGDIVVSGLCLDSRAVRSGDVFVALNGSREHGIVHLTQAEQGGAVAVLAQTPLVPGLVTALPVIWIEALDQRLGELAARFYGRPSAALRLTGVTGTNGKTSVVQLLAQAQQRLGYRSASIGTLGAGAPGALRAGERTTPDAIAVQCQLAAFREAGFTDVAMEVSSHALVQGRVNAVDFELAVFTNLTRDHLDYHGSMEAYGAAKAGLFEWPSLRAAAINIDDDFGRGLMRRPGALQRLSLSAEGDPAAAVRAEGVVASLAGLDFQLITPWGEGPVHSPLLGRFNVANLLAVVACLGLQGTDFPQLVEVLQQLQPVNGRMNRLGGEGGQPLVVIDYAHTPDALQQALQALREHGRGRLICVFGCGGDRDAGKRPLMGAAAEAWADQLVVTDDNPRNEDGEQIVGQILQGVTDPCAATVIRDRAAAIAWALAQAGAEDMVLVAGKGHETYQEGRQGRIPFDDFAVASTALEQYA
ncbi:UDP-N-acetylmuramoyl-L-alanyl-D-glutamate--2,6-diaminopimelate ligase [Frateuria aurantia]|uniref:UDP-N-acetylmuramoyl-L-alanyl-D-glutamate--2,6-diaminopimelate ligase n=1 Tax=Frateuria aurantia (strain ATCC 33424 / DSM 6220 / KCTC 2777 / LMG 1558 / NBRC 3245 / NCIMB 13370) TaxID=767434 RepID=H8L357_FRAAD|nr:UDP-N-acetylmuramoyl-L-alanyl-D-glutamate--2,6-diaminopimelate ligase [Frateuria aurantia]AFC84857.1 UDP-N-acetylmuramyl-tripeptide synthetase [Frateuria aurantia DSM 6220]